MRWIPALLSGLLLAAWLLLGSVSGLFGLPLPALGAFFNPARGFWQNTGEGMRTEQLDFHLENPVARGEIHFDDRGVPHIIAGSLESACFLQGYANAYDRLWQMDISTRSTEGALAQVLGPSMVARDLLQVRRGFREMARRSIDTMRQHFPEDLAALQAYADGVNAYVDQLAPADYPIEYKLLGHTPLRWSPYRTALLMKGMSAGLSGRYYDAAATKTRAALPPEEFRELFPERFPRNSPVVPDAGSRVSQLSILPDFTAWLPTIAPASAPAAVSAEPTAYTLMPPDPDNGSNNWAVAPARTNTRAPLLASDPHLSLSFPSVWYEAQITFPGCNARGVGLAGAPGLMMGFNDYVAWGETNVGHDVTDWYRIRWTDTARTAYLLDGREVTTDFIADTVRIKGEDELVVRTPWTYFGPVPETEGPYAELAMRWLAQDEPGRTVRPHTTVMTFLDLMQARNYTDYVDALRGYVDPAQNFAFAARDGDIAIRPNGFFPLRAPGEGRYIREGDSSKHNWQGTIPFAERPVHYNPVRGYVSSANQETTGPGYPYYYLGGFDEYRGRYINRVLDRQPTMNQRRMKELQLDDYSLLGEELAPILLARLDRTQLDGDERRVLRLLSEWDYRFTGESRGATLFDRFYRRLYALTFDEFPADSGLLRIENWKWNDLLREQPTHPVFDIVATDFRETAATLTQRVFDELLEELDGALPPSWAEERDAHIDHLGKIPGFGSPLITTGGARSTPRVVGDNFGGSWRMVIELGAEPRGWGALPGGASGNPGSRYYDNGFQEWNEGRYHELTRWSKPVDPIGSWIFE
ncbi:Acyl-homoserine lactone acylase QuiP [Neolewinella maritima]|uniref:Acyl-homoserine lactone acylase QuiP n=1 Tax=Neolewinella maritima TaxID=1383882 RepID=A0ABM9B4R4_9BACT|nr:penicillin acylase family protein [Neolewinella maritima]CAH1002346.1 Acyl-homoserine lactone acylase QuiP [Neolewinella maritima]